MQVEPLHEYLIAEGPVDVQNHINALQSQMKEYPNDKNQIAYDFLALAGMKRMLELFQEHPEYSDPTNRDQAFAMSDIDKNDPVLQNIHAQEQKLSYAHPSECTKWGIPFGGSCTYEMS